MLGFRFSWRMGREERGPSPPRHASEEVDRQTGRIQFGLGRRTGSASLFSADGLKLLMKF